MSAALVWFRRDLRLQDNPALQAALDAGHDVVPVYLHAPHEEGEWVPGAASDAWRHRSLGALDADLRTRGSSLVLRSGDSLPALQLLIGQTGAEAVYWNRKYEPATGTRRHHQTHAARAGIDAQSCNGSLLFEPWDIATQQGQPYKVFTPVLAQRTQSLAPADAECRAEGTDRALGRRPRIGRAAAGAHAGLGFRLLGALAAGRGRRAGGVVRVRGRRVARLPRA